MKIKIASPGKELILEAYENYSNIHEVAKHFNVPYRTVKCWLKIENISFMPTREELLEKCWTISRNECSKHYKVSIPTIIKWKKYYEINRYESKYGNLPLNLTGHQYNLVCGKLLGDSWLNKTTGKTNNAFFVRQKVADKEYVESVFEAMKPFSTNFRFSKTKDNIYKNRIIKGGTTCEMATIASPIFTKLRNEWYPQDKKIVPRDLELNWEIVTYWFCDDGCNQQKGYENRGMIYTQGFSFDDVEYLIFQLEKLGVKSHIRARNNQPIIAINSGDNYINFVENIKPYIVWNCMNRKTKERNGKENNT